MCVEFEVVCEWPTLARRRDASPGERGDRSHDADCAIGSSSPFPFWFACLSACLLLDL